MGQNVPIKSSTIIGFQQMYEVSLVPQMSLCHRIYNHHSCAFFSVIRDTIHFRHSEIIVSPIISTEVSQGCSQGGSGRGEAIGEDLRTSLKSSPSMCKN